MDDRERRDLFACQAIPAACERAKNYTDNRLGELFGPTPRGGIRWEEIVAKLAYNLADAMMAERVSKGR